MNINKPQIINLADALYNSIVSNKKEEARNVMKGIEKAIKLEEEHEQKKSASKEAKPKESKQN